MESGLKTRGPPSHDYDFHATSLLATDEILNPTETDNGLQATDY